MFSFRSWKRGKLRLRRDKKPHRERIWTAVSDILLVLVQVSGAQMRDTRCNEYAIGAKERLSMAEHKSR